MSIQKRGEGVRGLLSSVYTFIFLFVERRPWVGLEEEGWEQCCHHQYTCTGRGEERRVVVV